MRTGEPTPGLAHWFAMPMGEETILSLRFFVYRDTAHAAIQRVEPMWHAWMSSQFPSTP